MGSTNRRWIGLPFGPALRSAIQAFLPLVPQCGVGLVLRKPGLGYHDPETFGKMVRDPGSL